MKYEPIIGLEIHIQLNTVSKIFCSCSTKFGSVPNSQTCPVCLGLPGSLPVLNENALQKIIIAGLALNSTIMPVSIFHRKNYFYPDLPKAYQISQYDRPICEGGYVEIQLENKKKKIAITKLHLEEDAGKLIHSEDINRNISYIDFNRAGIPLLEIVSAPDIRSGKEAYEYLQKIKTIMKYIHISDVNMEKGSLRCDVNISIRKYGDNEFGKKVEIKNLNSFKAVKTALDYEIDRQISLIKANKEVQQETRLWDIDAQKTFCIRKKEDPDDYRYFPDPDIMPIIINDQYIDSIKKLLPELPDKKIERFISEYALPVYDAHVLCSVKQVADYYEDVVKKGIDPKKASNWILNELLAKFKDYENIQSCIVKPLMLAKLIMLIEKNTINGTIGKLVLEEMINSGKDPEIIVEEKDLKQTIDISEIKFIIEDVLKQNQISVDTYKKGKKQALKFLIGQVMKATNGKANPMLVNDYLLEKLK